MFKLLDRVNGIMSIFGGILILFMVLSITYSVATRAFHLDSPSGSTSSTTTASFGSVS